MMSFSELYSKGVKIWIPDQESVWIGATVLKFHKESNSITIITDNGKTTDLNLNNKIGCPFLRNPEILIGQKDLTFLSYLNEPEVLYNLQIRFCERREIYTYCGIVLVAVNPYQELSIYGNEIINAYHLQNSSDLDPHIFAVAENAFKRMSSFEENQAVIVSGESGAGKTVSAKYTMRYFALVGGSKNKQSSFNLSETQIERKVLLSNPILEAFGNAKTIRNDNSSRFGKYLEIMFNKRNQINGANMCTYLLEKSRVVFQNLGERNYHIFYQIVTHSQSGDDLLTNTGLINNVELYNYLRCGESLEIDGVDDAQEFLITKNSFLQLGIDLGKLKSICEILAAILHLGNVLFQSNEKTDSSSIENPELLKLISKLLGCSIDQLKIWLCFRSISTLQETLHKPLTKTEAQYFRDALVKTIYSNLFYWIVRQANNVLSNDITSKSKTKSKKMLDMNLEDKKKFIAILDIYGFETFEENSFEQFCINFANEKLQLQFNMHVFKLEQEEYMNEGLEWKFIDYYNNQPCIDLIESKLGLLDLLDEECKLLKGSDENWCCKIYSHHLNKSRNFSKPKLSNTAFIIDHFAGPVQYECSGFIEKNRDTVLEEQINLLKASDVPLISELFHDSETEIRNLPNNSKTKLTVTPSAKNIQTIKQENVRKMKKTVGSQFRNSLKSLMDTLNKTTPHYVRCIKPNDLKLPFTFCPERAVQQLRACGVLETIRLSAAGFPSRWTYQDFYQRYYILLSKFSVKTNDFKVASQKIVESLIKVPDAFRFGNNKLFFRAGQVAHLEKLRCLKIENSITLIQSILRGSLERKKYLHILTLVLKTQAFIRRKFAREKVVHLRHTRSAIRIQSYYRMYIARKKYLKLRKSVVTIENWWSKLILIKMKKAMKKENYIIFCQSIIRQFIQRKKYLKFRKAIIQIQNHYRRKKAKKELQFLKIESRSLNHIKFVNKGLENKIIELTQKLDSKEKEVCQVQTQLIKERKLEIENLKLIHAEGVKNYQIIIQDLQTEIIKLKKELSKEISEKNKLNTEKEYVEINYKNKIMSLETLIEELKCSQSVIVNSIPCKDGEIETSNCSSPDEHQKLINEQIDHQKLVREYEKLEMKYENLYKEFVFVKSTMHKSSVDSTDYRYKESNHSETESTYSKDDADIESLSDDTDLKTKRPLQCTVVTKNIPDYVNKDVCTAGDLAVVMQLQMHINSMTQENLRLKETIQELEDQLLKYEYYLENQAKEFQNQNSDDNEFYLFIKEIKDLDDHSLKSKLIHEVGYLKKQLKQANEEYQKLRRNIFTGTLGKLADDLDHECNHSEENELKMAFESQKEANRKMLKEIEEVKSQEANLRRALIQVRKEKEQLHIQIGKLGDLIGNMKLTPKERLDQFVQNELSRILLENIKLQERNDHITSETIQLKRGLKYFAFRLQKYEGALIPNPHKEDDLLQLIQNVIYNSKLKSDGKIECYSEIGLIDLNMSESAVFLKNFVFDLSPNICLQYEPYHLVPFIMFMITRKFDVFKEENFMTDFLSKLISALKRIVRKKKNYLEYLAMLLSNVVCLLNLFQQYSGIKQFSFMNTADDNQNNFVNYDLTEFIRLLRELCVTVFQMIMKTIVENLLPQSLCIDAILVHEDIKNLLSKDGTKYKPDLETQPKNTSFNVLIKNLQSILEVLKSHQIPQNIINQIFTHIAYLINAYCLNTLLFRTDLCYFSKGLQIKYNLSSFETWIRYQKLSDSGALQCLQPMIEAVQLLQTLLESEDDAKFVGDMCEYLNVKQVIKILNNFNPRDGYGCRLSSGLISKVEYWMKLKRREQFNESTLETPAVVKIPIEIPFIHNKQALNRIIIPKSLYLPCLTVMTEKDLV